MFRKTKKQEKRLSIFSNNTLIFQGNINQLPLRESVIIEKSIHFFDDPEPCYIHRSAIHVRLIAEIENQMQVGYSKIEQCPLLKCYADIDVFDTISFDIID